MHGDTLDVPRLYALMDRYPKLHAYADDAHGVAWTGRRGAGVVLGFHELHPRMVVVLGLAKGFGSAGAAVVCPNAELSNRIFSCGSSLVFSGPMQPAQLGAGIAAAKILLSDELPNMQAEVRSRITHFDRLCSDAGIYVPAAAGSPIRFVPVGDEQQTLDLCMKLQGDGHFTNISLFPAVPRGGGGIRVVLTRHLTLADIEQLVASLVKHCPRQRKVQQAA
jgi:7-keto-8-aminopelargonate synthetase-like enzyme